MLFDVDKCNVMYFGFNNALERYKMNGEQIVDVSEEKYWGIVIQNDLKWSKQCVNISSSGNIILCMIRRTFVYKTKEVIV